MSYGYGDKPHIFRCTWPGHSDRWRFRRHGNLHPQSFTMKGLRLRLGIKSPRGHYSLIGGISENFHPEDY